jgi:Protein of unknown function (DUF2939)
MSTLRKGLLALAVLVALLFYATPYLAVHQMRSAAAAHDAARLSGYVDFPALRASLKAGVQARLLGHELNEAGQPTPASAMGAAVAGALLGPLVDALITPESLGRVMQGQPPVSAATGLGSEPAAPERRLQTAMGYESPGRFVFSVKPQGDDEEPVELVLRREGLLHWKLAELRLP